KRQANGDAGAWKKPAVRLPVSSVFCPSTDARRVPPQPVENFCAVHMPRAANLTMGSRSVQEPDALSGAAPESTVQVPSKVRPLLSMALQVEPKTFCSLNVSFTLSLTATSAARTQPDSPCLV